MRLPAALLGILLLALLEMACAAPQSFKVPVLGPPIRKIPTPAVVRMQYVKLVSLAKKYTPSFVNGVATSPSFRPKILTLATLKDIRLSVVNPFVLPSADFDKTSVVKTSVIKTPVVKNPVVGSSAVGSSVVVPRAEPPFFLKAVISSTRMKFPYSAIGKVLVRDGTNAGWCTGSAVGPNLLLTASHCIPWESKDWSIEFVPGLDANDTVIPRPHGSAFAKQCLIIDPAPVDGRDYALCQLEWNLGCDTGYLGWQAFQDDAFYRTGNWTSTGYPDIFARGDSPVAQDEITITDVVDSGDDEDAKMLTSAPYADKGWSGGPLFWWNNTKPYLAGVVSSKAEVILPNSRVINQYTHHAAGMRMAYLIQYGLNDPDWWAGPGFKCPQDS